MPISELTFDLFKRQQSMLVLLNLGALAALVPVHISFISLLGLPSQVLLITLTVRFLLLIAELYWLQSAQVFRRSLVNAYHHLSIWLNLGFAFLVSHLAGFSSPTGIPDTHYSVLMILPIISAAFYFRLPGALAVSTVAAALMSLQVWLFYRTHPPADLTEYFEVATVSLTFLVVSLVVWLLVSNLNREHIKLQENLTELHATRDRLAQEEKLAAVGRLASGIAHEIRNPVAMISSSLTVATQQEQDPATRSEMYDVAAQEAARLERMTSDFLSYARSRILDRKSVALIDTLDYIASLGSAKASESNIEIKLDVVPGLRTLIDEFQIQQALLNLITNAFDAMPTGGVVTLGAHQETSHELTIYVENSGERISDEAVAHLFEPFFTTKEKGTGLGLSIVRNIAQAHGGRATLGVNKSGRVRFCITLPDEQTRSNKSDGPNSYSR